MLQFKAVFLVLWILRKKKNKKKHAQFMKGQRSEYCGSVLESGVTFYCIEAE